jgi:hypothetical protein
MRLAVRNESGAFDLPSILVGVLVVAVMALGVAAIVFGVIPWSQDKSAQQSLAAVSTAEGTYYGQSGSLGTASAIAGSAYAGLADLKTEKFLGQDVTGVDVQGGDKGWVAVTKSESGTWYWATNEAPTPIKIATQPTSTATLATVLTAQATAYTSAKIGTVNAAG